MARVEHSNWVHMTTIRHGRERIIMKIFWKAVASLCPDEVLRLQTAWREERLKIKEC